MLSLRSIKDVARSDMPAINLQAGQDELDEFESAAWEYINTHSTNDIMSFIATLSEAIRFFFERDEEESAAYETYYNVYAYACQEAGSYGAASELIPEGVAFSEA